MSELYWINVLGSISNFLSILMIFCGILGVLFLIARLVIIGEDEEEDDKKVIGRCLKYFAIIFAISCIGSIFIPDKNDLYVIYGVGNVIDYCKKNDDVKALPDNAVKALNLYLENNIKENKENEENN